MKKLNPNFYHKDSQLYLSFPYEDCIYNFKVIGTRGLNDEPGFLELLYSNVLKYRKGRRYDIYDVVPSPESLDEKIINGALAFINNCTIFNKQSFEKRLIQEKTKLYFHNNIKENVDEIGVAFHTALRKCLNTPSSSSAHMVISKIDYDFWSEYLSKIQEGLKELPESIHISNLAKIVETITIDFFSKYHSNKFKDEDFLFKFYVLSNCFKEFSNDDWKAYVSLLGTERLKD